MPRKGPKRMTANAVKEIVRKELKEELEEKTAVIGVSDATVTTAAIPNGDVTSSGNVVKLFPSITQGTGQYNDRIGNEIRLKHLDIKMLLNYALPDLSTATNEDTALGVRVMILRQKDDNAAAQAIENFQGNKLLENGVGTAGPKQFTGQTFNLVQKINREQFSVRYDKVHNIKVNYRQSSGGATAVSQSFFPPTTKVISKRLTFGKRGLKLTYGDGASEEPSNFPYLLVIGYASTVSSSVPSAGILRYSYSANAKYTDA
jgi:hypothetical protein